MTDKRFDSETEQYLVEYMNQNHPASVYWYAKVYGNLWDSEDASMLSIDKEGMELTVEMSDGAEQRIRVEFDHELVDDDDAQNTLVDMSIKAREIIMNQKK